MSSAPPVQLQTPDRMTETRQLAVDNFVALSQGARFRGENKRILDLCISCVLSKMPFV